MTRNREEIPEQEQDQRLDMMNTLLRTPHRNLASVYSVHNEMVKSDPLFYGHLGAWYCDTGEVRDHKEMVVINLCLSDFEGHRDAGLAMLREMPPYQVARVVDFIHGGTKDIKAQPARPSHGIRGRKDYRVATPARAARKEKYGLGRNLPRSLQTEVRRYLAEREADDDWFDSTVLVARKYIKRLMALIHYGLSERSQAIIFEGNPPEGSRLKDLKELSKAGSAAAQAEIIIDRKIPYRVASTVVTSMTPTVMLALVEVMSSQELINSLGALKRRGVMDNPDLKALIKEKLKKAKTSKRVVALKATDAIKASGVDADLAEVLEEVADTQIKSKGRIKRSTALLIDKSGSMDQAIDIGKRMGSMISAIMDAEFYCYAFDTMPYRITSSGKDLASWEKAFSGIQANNATCYGAAMVAMRNAGQRVEQIVLVGDEGENRSPAFLKSYEEYCTALNVKPSVFIIQTAAPRFRHTFGQIVGKLQRAGVDVDSYEFPLDGDYYSLPGLIQYLIRPSRLDLLMEIMNYPLPERKAS